jgi:hypothetical protein
MSNRKQTKVNRTRREATKHEAYKDKVEKRPREKSAETLKLMINPEDTPSNPLTHNRLMNWLADTGWVSGYVRKRISPMDAHLYEDFVQSIWVIILSVKPDVIMEIWYKGKGKFVNYIKTIIDINLRGIGSPNYNENKKFHNTHCTLSDEQWMEFEEGHTTTSWTDTYPVKYQCPSGNRKKMVYLEYEDVPISTDYNDLIDTQRHND